MTEHDPAAYSDRIFDVHDEWFGVPKDVEGVHPRAMPGG
jgi:hypothetical protein